MFENLILLAAATSAVVFAQTGPALNAQLVKTGLYVITGAGCNSVLRLSANGFILVDGGLPGNYDALMKKVGKITYSDQPIRALILTDLDAIPCSASAPMDSSWWTADFPAIMMR